MKILVPVKRVPDYEAKIKIQPDGLNIVTDGIKWILNPFDEIAVEEALRIKESGKADEVVVVSVGHPDSVTQMRYAMAMGADRGILVQHEGPVDSFLAARLLKVVYERGEFDLILMGKQSIDSDANQTPQLLAELLGIAHASFASKIEIQDSQALVTREVDGGLETIKISLPCVISADLRLNEPRYAPLPGIMKAKKKPLEELDATDFGVDLKSTIEIVKMSPPEKRKAGKIVKSVEELVKALQEEAKIL